MAVALSAPALLAGKSSTLAPTPGARAVGLPAVRGRGNRWVMASTSLEMEDVVGRGIGLAARGALAVIRRFPASWVAGGARALFSKTWGAFEAASMDPGAAQRARLLELVGVNKDTAFGREHDFAAIRTWEDFQRIPIRPWDGFAPYVRRMVAGEKNVLCADDVFFFARSSGTTGEPKNVPVTARYLDEFRHGRRAWTRQVAQVMPGAIRGHLLTVHSPSIDGHTPGGVPYGSITVAMGGGREDPTGFDAVPRSVFRLADYSARYYAAVRFALQRNISVLAAINPSTLVLLCNVMRDHAAQLATDLENGTLWDGASMPAPARSELTPRLRKDRERARRLRDSLQAHGVVRPVDVWPAMAGALCWKGGSAPFYLDQLQPLLPGIPIMDYGYAASEGCFSVPLDAGPAQGVAAAGGHVMEFVPWAAYEEGSRDALPMWELKAGEKYVVIITGGHGLCRYDMQDVVQVSGFHHAAPMLAFLHKAGNMVSITGEKLAESHVVDAVTAAAAELGVRLAGFSVAPELVNPPRYVLAVEPEAPMDDAQRTRLLAAADTHLQRVNIEYESKRKSLRLDAPVLRVLPAGAYKAHRASRVASGAPDAHLKSPHLARSLDVIQQLERTVP